MKSSINFEEKYTVDSNSTLLFDTDLTTEESNTVDTNPSSTSPSEVVTEEKKSVTTPTLFNTTPKHHITLQANSDFAKNEIFMHIMKDPSFYMPFKKNIIAYLKSQDFDKYINKDNFEKMLWGANDNSAMKHKNNIYARCSDKYDTIIKMYHLALMTEQDHIAKSIQAKMIIALRAYTHSMQQDLWRDTNIYFNIHKIALALDCYENVKTTLYNQLLKYFDKYALPQTGEYKRMHSSDKTSAREYHSLLTVANECELLDASFASKMKDALPTMNHSYPNDEYDSIVTLLNKASPNLISDDEYKAYVKTFLQKAREDEKSHYFDFLYGSNFVAGVMKRPYLYNDPEIFTLLLSRMRPLNFASYAQHFVNQFHETFETRQFEPWQTDLINAAKISAEKYYVENTHERNKEYPKYKPTITDEKISKFSGPQTVFINLSIPKKGYGPTDSFEIDPDLLLQPSILFEPMANLINASFKVHATQVGSSFSEASSILSQHSYYKHSSGAVAIEAIVDGSNLDFFSEADTSFAINTGKNAYPVLKKNSVIQPENVIGLHKIDIIPHELDEKVPSKIMNKDYVNYKEPEKPQSPSLFSKLLDKLSGTSKDENTVSSKPKSK